MKIHSNEVLVNAFIEASKIGVNQLSAAAIYDYGCNVANQLGAIFDVDENSWRDCLDELSNLFYTKDDGYAICLKDGITHNDLRKYRAFTTVQEAKAYTSDFAIMKLLLR